MEFKQWQPLASHADTLWARYTIVTPGLRDCKMYHQKKQVSLSEQGLQSHFWSYWFWVYCPSWTQETPGAKRHHKCWESMVGGDVETNKCRTHCGHVLWRPRWLEAMKYRTHCGCVVWCPRGLEAVNYRTHSVPGHYRTFVYASGCGFLGCICDFCCWKSKMFQD